MSQVSDIVLQILKDSAAPMSLQEICEASIKGEALSLSQVYTALQELRARRSVLTDESPSTQGQRRPVGNEHLIRYHVAGAKP